MSYGYYQLVRFLSLFGFSVLAIKSINKGLKNEAIIYISLAILFQPLFKISLGRELWNFVDAIVGIGLIGSIFIKK